MPATARPHKSLPARTRTSDHARTKPCCNKHKSYLASYAFQKANNTLQGSRELRWEQKQHKQAVQALDRYCSSRQMDSTAVRGGLSSTTQLGKHLSIYEHPNKGCWAVWHGVVSSTGHAQHTYVVVAPSAMHCCKQHMACQCTHECTWVECMHQA